MSGSSPKKIQDAERIETNGVDQPLHVSTGGNHSKASHDERKHVENAFQPRHVFELRN
jgi:hypothetical protein